MTRYIPKHRRPTRTDRLLLWAKDRLTLRRRPQPVLETADFEEALAEQEAVWSSDVGKRLGTFEHPTYGPVVAYGPMRGDDQAWWFDWMEHEVLAARDELETVGDVVRDWEKKL